VVVIQVLPFDQVSGPDRLFITGWRRHDTPGIGIEVDGRSITAKSAVFRP
jgi:hypothetical protein